MPAAVDVLIAWTHKGPLRAYIVTYRQGGIKDIERVLEDSPGNRALVELNVADGVWGALHYRIESEAVVQRYCERARYEARYPD